MKEFSLSNQIIFKLSVLDLCIRCFSYVEKMRYCENCYFYIIRSTYNTAMITDTDEWCSSKEMSQLSLVFINRISL